MFEVIHGDCLDVLRGMDDASIDLTVTSPPYDNLRTYNGFTFDFEGIARELYRVTRPGGVVVWVVGDATIKGSETGTSFRQALYFKDVCGFNLHDTMIYEKAGGGAMGSNRAYLPCHEYMFVFSKGRPNTVNLLYDRPNANWDKTGKYETRPARRNADGLPSDRKRQPGKPFGRRFNIWRYSGIEIRWEKTRGGFDHPAMFPPSLAADHIASWSNPGDVVLDPFMGSGTTGKMAVLAGRRFVGVDISAEYVELSRQRIEDALRKAA